MKTRIYGLFCTQPNNFHRFQQYSLDWQECTDFQSMRQSISQNASWKLLAQMVLLNTHIFCIKSTCMILIYFDKEHTMIYPSIHHLMKWPHHHTSQTPRYKSSIVFFELKINSHAHAHNPPIPYTCDIRKMVPMIPNGFSICGNRVCMGFVFCTLVLRVQAN